MNEAIQNILTRRSVRVYKGEQISGADLDTILEAAKFAPSGMNAQNCHFTVVQNKEKLEKLNALIREAVLNSPLEHLRKIGSNPNFNAYYKAPTLIILSADKNSYTRESDCAVALENILLAANSLSIGSCWIHVLSMLGDDTKVRSLLTELGVPENYATFGSAALGFNGGNEPKAAPRKEGTVNIVK
jgi:nitroreductase